MRFRGVNIPDQKRIEVALTYIYGIGPSASQVVLTKAKVSPDVRTKDLSADQVNAIKTAIEAAYRIEGELRQEIRQKIERVKSFQAYLGLRHMRRLPVRGQRTKTNSRTIRGNVRKTAGSGKRKVDLK